MSQGRRTQHFARSAKRREEKNKAPVTIHCSGFSAHLRPQVVVLRSLESGFHMIATDRCDAILANLKLVNQAFS